MLAAARARGIDVAPRWGGAADVPTRTLDLLTELLGELPDHPEGTRKAYVPPVLKTRRVFGVALQLYQLRSPRNLGIGDLKDLTALIPTFAEWGADFVGLNPLHALFTAEPERASPFSPSDRRFLNPMIIAVEDVPGYAPKMRDAVDVPSADEVIDHTAATRAKLSVLRAIHARWRAGDPAIDATARAAFARFRSEGGEALETFCLFEAISHAMAVDGFGAGWTGWPRVLQRPDTPRAKAFREAHQSDITFHAFLQFCAAQQLAATQKAATDAGMAIGLYLDLAVGAAPDGAATFADPSLVLTGVRIGAPPDLFTSEGQDWGLAPFSPSELVARDFAPYRAMLSAVLGPCGAVRIDHAMGLERLYLIPDGAPALEGAYVAYRGLTDTLVDETHRHFALAIGEDLGVVPEGFRERMAERALYSMRILPFERDGNRMRPPARFPAAALACLSTHDIAPLEAWWRGDDIVTRVALGSLSRRDAATAHRDRRMEKALLSGLAGLPPGVADRPIGDDLVVALHRVAARSASRLVAVRLEDVVGGRRLVNLPGTDREHPNWRHTLPLTVEAITQSERLQRVMAAMGRERR
ncbi:MAG: 4-alpha-glucanotransferase [Pseudomonadota bacterium]